MKIKCICLDDSNKPIEIPIEKWVKKNEVYHITWVFNQLNQPGVKGVELEEFDISMCIPFNCYRLSRFAISIDDLELFKQMCRDSNELNGLDIDGFIEDLIESKDLILQN